MKKNAGFTLIELLVAVLIIGVLSTVALPKYEKAVLKSRAAAGLAKLKGLETAQKEFFLANGVYATDVEDLSLDTGEWNCGVGFCQFRVAQNLLWEFHPLGNSSPIYRIYCIAGNNSSSAQQICDEYGDIDEKMEDTRSTYYQVSSLQ